MLVYWEIIYLKVYDYLLTKKYPNIMMLVCKTVGNITKRKNILNGLWNSQLFLYEI